MSSTRQACISVLKLQIQTSGSQLTQYGYRLKMLYWGAVRQAFCAREQATIFHDDIYAASEAIAGRLMYQSLTTWEGAEAQCWHSKLGVPLEKIYAQDPTASLLEYFSRKYGLIKDQLGVRVPQGLIAPTLIELQFINGPKGTRRVISGQTVLRSY